MNLYSAYRPTYLLNFCCCLCKFVFRFFPHRFPDLRVSPPLHWCAVFVLVYLAETKKKTSSHDTFHPPLKMNQTTFLLRSSFFLHRTLSPQPPSGLTLVGGARLPVGTGGMNVVFPQLQLHVPEALFTILYIIFRRVC